MGLEEVCRVASAVDFRSLQPDGFHDSARPRTLAAKPSGGSDLAEGTDILRVSASHLGATRGRVGVNVLRCFQLELGNLDVNRPIATRPTRPRTGNAHPPVCEDLLNGHYISGVYTPTVGAVYSGIGICISPGAETEAGGEGSGIRSCTAAGICVRDVISVAILRAGREEVTPCAGIRITARVTGVCAEAVRADGDADLPLVIGHKGIRDLIVVFVVVELEVKVVSGGVAGGSHISDHLSAGYVLPLAHSGRILQMPVERAEPIGWMFDHDVVAESGSLIPGFRHSPRLDCIDGVPGGACNVDRVVEIAASAVGFRISAVPITVVRADIPRVLAGPDRIEGGGADVHDKNGTERDGHKKKGDDLFEFFHRLNPFCLYETAEICMSDVRKRMNSGFAGYCLTADGSLFSYLLLNLTSG